jgi:hypothetical protein
MMDLMMYTTKAQAPRNIYAAVRNSVMSSSPAGSQAVPLGLIYARDIARHFCLPILTGASE